MATTKTELLNNGAIVATKTSAPFYAWDWIPSGTGASVLTYKRYEDDVLVYTSGAINGTVEAVAAGQVTYDALFTFDKIENPTYTGSSIQICDIDGTNLLDIGFSGDELDIAAINAFGVTKHLNKIYDKSGNNNHLEYTTGVRPVVKAGTSDMYIQGGKPAVKFAEVATKMFAPATLTGENGLSIFVVNYNDTTSGASKGIYGKWNGSPGGEYVLSSRGSGAPNEVILSTKNSSDAQVNIFTGVSLTTKKLRLFTVLNDTANSYTRIDGIDKGSSAGAIRSADAMLQVGGYGGSDNNESMFFSEMRIKKGYIADFAAVESAIITKYGIV